MATNNTEHYGLCQWEEDDSFLRTDFNEDNEKIDAALTGKAEQDALDALDAAVALRSRICAATYMGNGAERQYIDVGFPIQAVLVECKEGNRVSSDGSSYGGLALPGVDTGKEDYPVASVSDRGFYVYHWTGSKGTLNLSGRQYRFLAFG